MKVQEAQEPPGIPRNSPGSGQAHSCHCYSRWLVCCFWLPRPYPCNQGFPRKWSQGQPHPHPHGLLWKEEDVCQVAWHHLKHQRPTSWRSSGRVTWSLVIPEPDQWQSRENRKGEHFKFVDDEAVLGVVDLLSIGIASHNYKASIPSNVRTSGLVISNANLKEQEQLRYVILL